MKTSGEIIIPLVEQPRYQEAVAKVVKISRAHSTTVEKLENLRAQLASAQNNLSAQETPGLVDRALGIAAGAPNTDSQPFLTITAEISRLEVESKELYNGLRAANQGVDNIAAVLGRELGDMAKQKHIAAVAHIRACLVELCAANDAEAAVRANLEKLGYQSHGLPHQGFESIGRLDDSWGSAAFYFARDSSKYIVSQKSR